MSSSISQRKLIILGLPWATTDATFKEYFEKFGEVEDCIIIRDMMTGKSRGFGFVTFSQEADTQQAMRQDHAIDGRKVELQYAVPREDMEPKAPKSKKVFVGRLLVEDKEDDLKEYFEQFGAVTDVYIPINQHNQTSRCFAFVTFESEETVEKVMKQRDHMIKQHKIAVDKAEPKQSRGDMHHSSRGDRRMEQRYPDTRYGGYYGGGYGHPMDDGMRHHHHQDNRYDYQQHHRDSYMGQYNTPVGMGISQIPRGYHHHHHHQQPADVTGGGYRTDSTARVHEYNPYATSTTTAPIAGYGQDVQQGYDPNYGMAPSGMGAHTSSVYNPYQTEGPSHLMMPNADMNNAAQHSLQMRNYKNQRQDRLYKPYRR